MMVQRIVALASGVIFGAGLAVGGMTDPARVRGFLDFFGDWDPTLAFVMGTAIVVMAIAWRIERGMKHPLYAKIFHVPTRRDITPRLVIGSALFGIGWGMAGLCPGPGIASFAVVPLKSLTFVFAMVVGMTFYHFVARPKRT